MKLLQKNSDFEKLHSLENERIEKAKTLLAKVHRNLKGDMETFFQVHEHSEILAQWQARTERRFNDMRANLEKQAEEHCRTMIYSREAHILVDRMEDSYRGELLKCVKELGSKLQGKKLSETWKACLMKSEQSGCKSLLLDCLRCINKMLI